MGENTPDGLDEVDVMDNDDVPFEDGTPNLQQRFDKALNMVVRHYLDKTFLDTDDVVRSLRYTAENIEDGLEPTTDTVRSAVQYVALETGSRVEDFRGELVDARTIDGVHVVTTKVTHETSLDSWYVPNQPVTNLYLAEAGDKTVGEVAEEHVETHTE